MMSEKLVRWLMFSVVLALIPIAFETLSLLTRGKSATVGQMLEHGELYLVATGLCATATGELFGSGERLPRKKIICGGATIIVLLFAALCFADVSAAQIGGGAVEVDVVRNLSLLLLGCAVLSSAACVKLAEA